MQLILSIIRCIVTDSSYSDKLVANLLQRLQQQEEKSRSGSLMIIRHLINSAGPNMDAKKALVISGLRILLSDPSNKVTE